MVDNVPRKALVRDLSFSGAKIIMPGVAKFLVNKAVTISVEFEDPLEIMKLTGTILRFESVESRPDIAAFAVQFTEGTVPMAYKMRLTDYFRQIKKKPGSESGPANDAPVESTTG